MEKQTIRPTAIGKVDVTCVKLCPFVVIASCYYDATIAIVGQLYCLILCLSHGYSIPGGKSELVYTDDVCLVVYYGAAQSCLVNTTEFIGCGAYHIHHTAGGISSRKTSHGFILRVVRLPLHSRGGGDLERYESYANALLTIG